MPLHELPLHELPLHELPLHAMEACSEKMLPMKEVEKGHYADCYEME